MPKQDDWFAVSKKGLEKQVQERGVAKIVTELFQNAWDQDVTKVDATLSHAGPRRAMIVVEDDDPAGFDDLAHAYTMFAESIKKSNPTQRGRFNLGEKFILAICEEATISSTTGTVIFNEDGRRTSREKRDRGSRFAGLLKMTRAELDEAIVLVNQLIPPNNIPTTLNGELLPNRRPVTSFEVSLPTLIADNEGIMKPTTRKTMVEVHRVLPGEEASIYEMGIPVVATGDKYHYNVMQKVPLNMNRDNVTPKYLQTLRTFVFNEIHDKIDADEASDPWVRAATGDERCAAEAVDTAMKHRFGDKRVIFDPSDPEANMAAVSQGYTLITGRQMNRGEWTNAKAGGLLPAGKVTPRKPVFDGTCACLSEDQLTAGMKRTRDFAVAIAKRIMDVDIDVAFLDDDGGTIAATYERTGSKTGHLVFYANKLGTKWFEKFGPKMHRLIIHELGHHGGHHLEDGYHEQLCQLGAKLLQLSLDEPEFFERFQDDRLPV